MNGGSPDCAYAELVEITSIPVPTTSEAASTARSLTTSLTGPTAAL